MPGLSGAPILLISDLDDTIKISHTQSKLVTVYRGLFRSSSFAGMAQLYHEILNRHPGSEFHIVSSSPPQIQNKILFFLSKNGFPLAKLTLRDWRRQPSIPRYKVKALLKLVRESQCPVILVGDDTEFDPEIFAHVVKRCPERVVARYIRQVRGRELPPGSMGFFTAFDIACAELTAGRLDNTHVLRVGDAVLKAEKPSWLIPWFSLKPPLQNLPFADPVDALIVDLWGRIQEKIQAIPRKKK